MAGSAACCTPYTRHCPLFPVQSQPAELPATTVGEWRRRHSLRRHKEGTRAAFFNFPPPGFNVSLREMQQGPKMTSGVTGPGSGQGRPRTRASHVLKTPGTGES